MKAYRFRCCSVKGLSKLAKFVHLRTVVRTSTKSGRPSPKYDCAEGDRRPYMYIVYSSKRASVEALKLSETFRFLYNPCAQPVVCLSSECCQIMSTMRRPNMPKHPVRREKIRNLTKHRLPSFGETLSYACQTATASMVYGSMRGNMNSRNLPENLRTYIRRPTVCNSF